MYIYSIGIAYIDTFVSLVVSVILRAKGYDQKGSHFRMAARHGDQTPSPPVGWKASPGSPGVAKASVHGHWSGAEHPSPPLQGSSDLGKGQL